MKSFTDWLFRFASSQRNIDLVAIWGARVAMLIGVPLAFLLIIGILEK